MFGGSGAFWRHPRRPLAGVAAAAIAGVLLGEAAWRWGAGWADDPWTAAAIFLVLLAAFSLRPTRALFWPVVVAGYATLHLFYSAPVAALRLAGSVAAATTPGDRAVIAVTGTILDLPRVARPPAFGPPGAAVASSASAAATPTAAAPTASVNQGAGPLWRFTLGLDSATISGEHWPNHARVSVAWRDGPPRLVAGEHVALSGTAANLVPPRNPGEFDLAAWRRRRDILSELRVQGVADGVVLPAADSWIDLARARLAAATAEVREWVGACLGRDLEDAPDVRAVTSSMLLGLHGDPGLGDELEDLFQRTGTLHYFAIDGLKLGLIAALCLRLLEFSGSSRATVNRWILPLLCAYALATGLGPASLRAVFIAAVVVGGAWLERPVRPGNGLGGAAAVLLLFDTRSLFDLGFQLTFLVVLSILTLAQPLAELLRRLGAPDPLVPRQLYSRGRLAWEWLRRGALDLTAVALAAWVGSLPIVVWAFGWVSPISPLANVLSFPLAFAVLALSILSVAGGVISGLWSAWMNNANWLVAKAFLAVVRACDAVPGGSWHVGDPTLWHWRAPVAEVTLLDTSGQGFAAHLRTHDGQEWLLDTARPPAYGRIIRPYLLARAVERLGGGLLLTQCDAPHLTAAPLALTDFAPARLVEASPPSPRSPTLRVLREALGARGGPPETFCQAGDTIALGAGVRAVVLAPPAATGPGQTSAAARALVLRIEAAGWRVLWLPGASPRPGAAASLTTVSPADLRCDAIISPTLPQAGWSPGPAAAWVLLTDDCDGRDRAAASPLGTTAGQRASGALMLGLYADRMEVRGFLDGRTIVRWRTSADR